MSSKESLRNRLATLMDRHRALDKQVSDDYKNRVDDSIIQKETCIMYLCSLPRLAAI
mgnify:CR=1 FL=1